MFGMKNAYQKVLLLVASGIFLSGCTLPWAKPAATPVPTPEAQRLTPDNAPFTTLTITSDKKSGSVSGHTFTMAISNIDASQKTLEYVLLYDLPDGRQQGIPGSIDTSGKSSITRDDLLMGSCSKVCRFDDGVTKGTIELTYRDASGNATGDALGDWHLQSSDKLLTSVDGSFQFQQTKSSPGWFVTMTSFGLPQKVTGKLLAGPFAVTTSSSGSKVPGLVTFKSPNLVAGATISLWDGISWKSLATKSASGDTISAEAPTIGTFALVSSSSQ